jgi:hypothetical protein
MAKTRNAAEKRVISVKWGDKVYSETVEGNIELSVLTPDECEQGLNRATGKFAYYASLRADAKHMQSNIETDFEMWEAEKLNSVANDPDYKKLTTDKARKTQVMIDFSTEWKSKMKVKRDIQLIIDKLLVLVNAFELMTKTLQSVLAMRRVELGSAQHSGFAKGHGDLLEGE